MTKNIKRLYRSNTDKVLLGLCAGVAEYFELDPILVRAATIAVTVLSGGAGLVAYLLVALIVPVKPSAL